MGTQDDFAYTQDFLQHTGVTTPTMLWDPSFTTWQALGVTVNSQMALISADLESGTELFFGFDDGVQTRLLEMAQEL